MAARQSLARIKTSFTDGINTVISDVEVTITPGLPTFDVLGLPDSSLKESRGRIRAALTASGFKFPQGHITVSISPAYIRKAGTSFDLPIALGILLASGQIMRKDVPVYAEGELALNGTLRKTPGAALRLLGSKASIEDHYCVIPEEQKEAACCAGLKCVTVKDLKEAVSAVNMLRPQEEHVADVREETALGELDFSCVKGQEKARRALLIAAAGKHNVLLLGSPGCGKSLAAGLIRDIMPGLDKEELTRVYAIREASGTLKEDERGLSSSRPFRVIYPGMSLGTVMGSSLGPKPGELALADSGILFADEICEFKNEILEALRLPLEQREVRLRRDGKTYVYPASFVFVGAGNPCKCGNLFEKTKRCTCNASVRKRYQSKLSGPFLDRIDVFVEMRSISKKDMEQSAYESNGDLTFEMREQVRTAWVMQNERYGDAHVFNGTVSNINAELLRADTDVIRYASELSENAGFTARGFNRILRVGRTIADIDGRDDMLTEDIAEAAMYRNSFAEAANGR